MLITTLKCLCLSSLVLFLIVLVDASENKNGKRSNNNSHASHRRSSAPKIETRNTDEDEFGYISQYSNTRSLSSSQFSSNDACHLNIECNNNKAAKLTLPIFGPKGEPGPPGMPGQKGERGEPGIAGIPAREPPPPNFSAFFAALANNTGPFKQDRDLVFTQVVTNYGESYDAATGHYTAPFNGIYQFLVTVSATGRNKAGVNLMRNKQSVLTVWSESEPWSTSSQTVLLRLSVGDRVYLRLQSRASHIHGYMYSSFGGNLLYEEVNQN